MELLIIIGLVLLNGVFSMSEMALVSSRKFKLELAKKAGNKGAKKALELLENPNKFFSTVQIGITLIGVLLGVYSGENLTKGVENFLMQVSFLKDYAHNIAVIGIVVFITYLSIVLGELFPKRLGLSLPEPIIMLLARPMHILSVLTSPFVWLLTISNDILSKITGIKTDTDEKISEEEIKSIIRDSADGGEIQEIEQDIVERVFEMGDRRVKSLMTHRSEIAYFEEMDTFDEIIEKIQAQKHAVYPVCKAGNLDEIIGIVHLKDLFAANQKPDFSLKNHLHKPLFISDNMQAYKLLEMFRQEKKHHAIIVDEYGGTKGMVTMTDVVNALVGKVEALNEDEDTIVQRDSNSWLVDGQYPISEFLKYFDIQLDKQHNPEFATVGGLFISHFKALPNIGDKIIFEGYELEVIDKDGNRIDKIMVQKS